MDGSTQLGESDKKERGKFLEGEEIQCDFFCTRRGLSGKGSPLRKYVREYGRKFIGQRKRRVI